MNTLRFLLLMLATLVLSTSGKLYSQTNSTYYDQRESLFQKLPAAHPSIVFLGNSITDGGEWNALFPDRNVVNRGISGDRTRGILDRLPTILRDQPEKIFLMIGVNDLAGGRSVSDITQDYQRIVAQVKTESPRTELYIQSILPVNPAFGKFQSHVDKVAEILKINDVLKQLSNNYGYTYVDLHTPFSNADGYMDARYTNDGLHLTGQGYLLWKSLIFHHVYSLSNMKPTLIPLPRVCTWTDAQLWMQRLDRVYFNDTTLSKEANQLTKWWPTPITTTFERPSASQPQRVGIFLQLDAMNGSNDHSETYTLTVDSLSIRIRARTAHGIFNGIQTLRQLARNGITIPGCQIEDWPAFSWRGFMHDVGRNYQTVAFLEEQIDILSQYKLNVFHLHLTEDVAWRLESKKYPQLTKPETMTREAGAYYTIEELKQLSIFCKTRHITLIPEIDMPGHSAAFTRAMGVDMQSEKGKLIVADLLRELYTALDVPVIHIGSDEVEIRDTGFIPFVSKVVQEGGRQVMGWRPGGNLPEHAIRQLWIGNVKPDPSKKDVDSRHLYLNHLDPLESVATIFHRQIGGMTQGTPNMLGAIACVWPDRRVARQEDILHMNGFYPAMLTFAERTWQGGGQPGYRSDIGVYQSPDWMAFKAFEERLIDHQRLYFRDKSFPYVAQSDVHWKLYGPFDNNGVLDKTFWPEQQPQKLDTAKAFTELSGGTIYLRHFWSPMIQSHLTTYKPNQTIYAATTIYSPYPRTALLWAGFNNPSRSTATDTPPVGQWDYAQSKIWINGVPVEPPAWKRPGQKGHLEIPLLDESYAYRAPIHVQLKAGLNRVVIKAPVGGFEATGYHNPVKWMFSAALFEETSAGYKTIPSIH